MSASDPPLGKVQLPGAMSGAILGFMRRRLEIIIIFFGVVLPVLYSIYLLWVIFFERVTPPNFIG